MLFIDIVESLLLCCLFGAALVMFGAALVMFGTALVLFGLMLLRFWCCSLMSLHWCSFPLNVVVLGAAFVLVL